MTKWAVMSRITPYEVFDTKDEAEEFAVALAVFAGIQGFVVEDECP